MLNVFNDTEGVGMADGIDEGQQGMLGNGVGVICHRP